MVTQMVPEVPGQSYQSLSRLAAALTERVAPQLLTTPGPFPVFEAFDGLPDWIPAVKTGVGKLPDGVLGVCCPDGQILLSSETYRGVLNNEGRARFTTAHELCHAIHHRTHIKEMLINSGRLILQRRESIQSCFDPEWQANAYAGFLLMPTESVAAIVRRHATRSARIGAMTAEFMVSRQSADIRHGLFEKRRI